MPNPRPFDDENLQKLDSAPRDRTIAILEQDVLKIITDDAGGGITYYGWAQTGSKVTSPVWKIMRETIAGNLTTYEWADGDGKHDNIFNDRGGLSYE